MPTLLATSPLAATRSQPTITASTSPQAISPAAAESTISSMRDPEPRELVRRQPRALEQRPRLGGDHLLEPPARRELGDHGERRPAPGRRERAGVAVGEDHAGVGEQLGPVGGDRLARGLLLGLDRPRLGERRVGGRAGRGRGRRVTRSTACGRGSPRSGAAPRSCSHAHARARPSGRAPARARPRTPAATPISGAPRIASRADRAGDVRGGAELEHASRAPGSSVWSSARRAPGSKRSATAGSRSIAAAPRRAGRPRSGARSRRSRPRALLELARLVHLGDDVAAADELAVDEQLRDRRPVGQRRELLADPRVGEHVDGRERAPERLAGSRPCGPRSRTSAARACPS